MRVAARCHSVKLIAAAVVVVYVALHLTDWFGKSEAERKAADLATVQQDASVTATMLVASWKQCDSIGIPDVDKCAALNGTHSQCGCPVGLCECGGE